MKKGCVRQLPHAVHAARGPRQAAAAVLDSMRTRATKIAIVSLAGEDEKVQVHTFAVDKKGGVSKSAAKIGYALSLQTAASFLSRSGTQKCSGEGAEEDEDEAMRGQDPGSRSRTNPAMSSLFDETSASNGGTKAIF